MSRSLLLPMLALAGIILYGTTQAARPDLPPPSTPVVDGPTYEEMVLSPTEPEAPTRPPPPPPAPRLQSEVEAEARAEAVRRPAATAGDSLDGPTDGTPEI